MTYTVITPADLGTGLKVEAQKVVVDVAALSLPVDVKLAGVSVDKVAQTMKFTLSNGTEIEQNIADFLAVDTDTTLASGSYAANTITLVDSEGGQVQVDLTTLKTEINQAIDAAKQEALAKATEALEKANTLEPRVETLEQEVATLKTKKVPGVVVQSLGGDTLGYLVTAEGAEVAGA